MTVSEAAAAIKELADGEPASLRLLENGHWRLKICDVEFEAEGLDEAIEGVRIGLNAVPPGTEHLLHWVANNLQVKIIRITDPISKICYLDFRDFGEQNVASGGGATMRIAAKQALKKVEAILERQNILKPDRIVDLH